MKRSEEAAAVTAPERYRPVRRSEEPGALAAPEGYRPPYLAALLATLAVWAPYALTLAPTTAFWDTSEYIATGHILGIPHPPGNPLFVILARTWDILLSPFGLPVAVRINLFSATMGAFAHGCWFLLAHRVMAFYSESRWFRLIGASAAAVWARQVRGSGDIKTIDVTASRFQFEPATISVSQGDNVRLRLHSADRSHAFAIKAFRVKALIPNGGETVTVEFIADRAGTFAFTCSEYCGAGHSRMKGKLLVVP